ncbi:MAG: DUF6452 family protein [Prevotellaceae bacterium]|nr:DUF6452 family protein [Prevotellaceae bacterium]
MRGLRRCAFAYAAICLALTGCEGIDCTLNNVVLCHYNFYSSETGTLVSLADTLTVTAQGTDSVLYNQGANLTGVSLPMSYYSDADTLVFTLQGDGYRTQSTVRVEKSNTEHYESPDCPATMFHYLSGVSFSSMVIDSIVIKRAEVDYLQDENIRVYFHNVGE